MSAINDGRLSYTSLIGQRVCPQSASPEEMVASLDSKIDEMVHLSAEEEAIYRAAARGTVRNKINEQFLLSVRGMAPPPPAERILVTRVEQTMPSSAPFLIYERDTRRYESLEERAVWQPRINTIDKAMKIREIFSVSIVPTNPDIPQSWYTKRVTYQPPELDHSACARAGIDPSFLEEPSRPSEAISLCITIDVDKIRTEKDNRINSPRIAGGFFAPYYEFSSNLVASQFDPLDLPPEVASAHVLDEEERSGALSNIDPGLQDRISAVIEEFQADVQARGLGLMPILGGIAKPLYFYKD